MLQKGFELGWMGMDRRTDTAMDGWADATEGTEI